jgi:hypothetical protein
MVRYLIPLYVVSVFMLDGNFVHGPATKPLFTKHEYFSSSLQQKPEDKNKEGVVQIIDSSHFNFVPGEIRGYHFQSSQLLCGVLAVNLGLDPLILTWCILSASVTIYRNTPEKINERF